jgi:hypothetical protein
MIKKSFVGKKRVGLFKATLLIPEGVELAVLILSGDGSSDCLQENASSGETFAQFLYQNLVEDTNIVVDAENLTFAGSLLLGTLGSLYYNKKKKEMLFITGGDFEVRRKLEQLIGLYSIEEKNFLFWLDEAMDRYDLFKKDKEIVFAEKIELGGIANISPETNFLRRALGTGEEAAEKISRAKKFLEKHYGDGFFRVDGGNNALVLTSPILHFVVFLYAREVLIQHNLYDETGEGKRKISRSELEWIIYELTENSRFHGYNSSDFGIIFVYHLVRKDRLFLIFEDHGGIKLSTYRGAHAAYMGIQNLLQEKFPGDFDHKTPPPFTFAKGSNPSKAELARRVEKAKSILQSMFKEGNQLEEIGPGYQIAITFPVPPG